MSPADREALRTRLERTLDRIDEVEELRAAANKEHREELRDLRGNVKQIRKWLSGREHYQPDLPGVAVGAAGWDCVANGHVFSEGKCGHCGQQEPDDPASGAV